MGTSPFEDGSVATPCFSDVLEAQRWAVQVVRQAEAEAATSKHQKRSKKTEEFTVIGL